MSVRILERCAELRIRCLSFCRARLRAWGVFATFVSFPMVKHLDLLNQL